MREEVASLERVAARLASRQHGVVTRQQLLDAGASSSAIGRRVEKGYFIQEHAGVYRVGHGAQSAEATYMAASLAAGDDAALAGRAAGHLMRLLREAPARPEVVAPKRKQIDGVITRRDSKIDHRETWIYSGIRCTTVARTVVDLAADLSEDDLARAVHEATVRYRTRPEQIEAVLARRSRSKGASKLRAILRGDTKVTLSKLEKRFLELLEEHGLELPETNERIGSRYIDCRWPERKLTVELDGYRYHATRHAWEQDRRREREARRRGDDFRRFTWGDVFEEPDELVRELRSILAL